MAEHRDTTRLRAFLEDDFDAFAGLLAAMWHPGDDPALSAWQGAEELAHHLACASWGVVAERDGRALGLALVGEVRVAGRDGGAGDACDGGDGAGTDRDAGGAVDAAAWEARHEALLAGAPELPDGGRADADGLCAEETRLMARTLADDGAGVGVLQLLVVSPEARGLGLGRRLMGVALDRMRRAGARRYRLSTDEACDWRFYEHLGLTRVAQEASGALGAPDRPFLHFVYEGGL